MAIAAAIRVFAGRMLTPLTPVGIRLLAGSCRVDWLDDCRRSDRPADCQSELDHGQPVHQRKLSGSWNSTIPVPAVWCADEKLPLMDTGYPGGLPASEPAPPYAGEGPFALWHFSEDPSLGRFLPHTPATNPQAPPLVWAVDTRHAPMFWFPRDCPRGCIWPVSTTTAADRERFFGQSATSRVHVIEAGWLRRVRECRLYAYRLPTEAFWPHEV